MTESFDNAAERMAADLTVLRQDFTRMAGAVSTLLQQQTEAVGSKVSEIAGDANDKIGRAAGQARSHVYAAGHAAELGIKRNAVASTLISFAIGISIGWLSRVRG